MLDIEKNYGLLEKTAIKVAKKFPNLEFQDSVQDILLRIFEQRKKYRDIGKSPAAWAYTVGMNYLRTKARLTNSRPNNLVINEELDTEDDSPGPEELAYQTQIRENLELIITTIPNKNYSRILKLHSINGMSYNDIAKAEELPVGTVMSRLHRARKFLAEHHSRQKPF